LLKPQNYCYEIARRQEIWTMILQAAVWPATIALYLLALWSLNLFAESVLPADGVQKIRVFIIYLAFPLVVVFLAKLGPALARHPVWERLARYLPAYGGRSAAKQA
jgi:hypothetical protein